MSGNEPETVAFAAPGEIVALPSLAPFEQDIEGGPFEWIETKQDKVLVGEVRQYLALVIEKWAIAAGGDHHHFGLFVLEEAAPDALIDAGGLNSGETAGDQERGETATRAMGNRPQQGFALKRTVQRYRVHWNSLEGGRSGRARPPPFIFITLSAYMPSLHFIPGSVGPALGPFSQEQGHRFCETALPVGLVSPGPLDLSQTALELECGLPRDGGVLIG